MSDKVIVSKSEIEKLFNRFTTPTHRLETIMQYIDQATHVSGEVVKLRMVYPDFTLIGCAKCGSHDVGGHESSVTCYKCGQTHKSDDKHNATIVWNNAQLFCLSSTPQPAPQIKDFDLAYTCKRIRRLLKLLNIPDPSPDNDEVLLGCLFSLLGTACGIIERQQPAPDTVPVEKYNRAIEALKTLKSSAEVSKESFYGSVDAGYIIKVCDKALAEAMKGE